MSFDPKIAKVGPGVTTPQGNEVVVDAGKASAAPRNPQLAMPDLDAARAVSKQNDAVVPSAPLVERLGTSRLEQRFADLEVALAKVNSRQAAIKSAIALCASSAARRSRGARRLGASLCDALDDVAPELEATIDALRLGFSLDEALQSGSSDALLSGLTAAAELDDDAESLARALVLSQSSQALAMLAQHYPSVISDDGVLERAFSLAEEALATAPELAEAHAALAGLIMLHGDLQALRDAENLVRRGLTFEPEHDTSVVVLATILGARGDHAGALTVLADVHTRGSARPLALLATARAHRGMGAFNQADAVLQRALKMAPHLPALHLEACIVARALADDARFTAHRDRAAALLGDAVDVDSAIALGLA